MGVLAAPGASGTDRDSAASPCRDERNMAALAQGIGVIAAFPVWLAWRRRSAFVRMHAVQSMLLDAIVITALLVVTALVVGIAVAGSRFLQDASLVFVVLICAPGMALIGLLGIMVAALVLRLRAAIAATQGKLYRYPLLGRI